MRRRTFSRQKTDIELFPFLSILACTIGTLILLIIVLTTQSLNQSQSNTNPEKLDDNSKDKQIKIIARDQGENGNNQAKTPRYIECTLDGVIIYPNKIFVPKENISDFNSPLQELITLINFNKEKEYLIIAVRPDGIDVFKQVRNLVEGAKIDMGYEPIDEDWELVTGEIKVNETQK